MPTNVISYNKASARELGWDPGWFGGHAFDWDLIKRIKSWQRAQGLEADGMIGPASLKRKVEERRSLGESGGISRQVLYNRASEVKLGWKPGWFDAEGNDEALVALVKRWQTEHGLSGDGMVGDSTYRRLLAEREARSPVRWASTVAERPGRQIIYNGEPYPIEWSKVVLWTEDGGIKLPSKNYRSWAGRPRRDIKMFVNHWDATTSAAQRAKALLDRGLSVHFALDNDGTIYQLVDMQHLAWHARGVNLESVGVEISNAYYTKYQDYYARNFGPRPIRTGVKVHTQRLGDFLGFYDEQVEALKALWKAVHLATGVPLETPVDAAGKPNITVDPRVQDKTYRGFINHYNVKTLKIDCASLEMVRLIDEVRESVGVGRPPS